uniref:Arrestin_C domain-containing protein n=1 Tax=Bursaphelenchus xylophilus TaxID=6326 RepID=A0A1I7ST79_BURXY
MLLSLPCTTIQEMPTVLLNLILPGPKTYSGEFLEAKVCLDSADPCTTITEFYAEVRGRGRTGWVNVHTDKIYETEKEYLNATVNLCPQGLTLGPGRHQFPFRVGIPPNAPSSYESQFGVIRYTVRVVLMTNSEQSTAVEIFPFIVVSTSYFDDIPSAVMQPIDYKDEVDFTVCSLPFGTIHIKVSLPKTGYQLGEEIKPAIYIKNGTRKTIKDCNVQLVLKAQFTAISRYEHVNDCKLVEQQLDNIPLGRVKGRSETNFNTLKLTIPDYAVPSVPPDQSEMEHSIISLSYVLQFTAQPQIEMEIPLMITSLGYRQQPMLSTRLSTTRGSPYNESPTEYL